MLDEELLFKVARPGQYLGNEWGAARKPFDSCDVHLCLAFPDLYELGMSNFGQRILYQIVNDTEGFLCDRTYAPDSDLEELIRQHQLPLWSWESRSPLTDFELLGFSLQYELTFTNVLNMLELSGIPIASSDRTSVFPLVFGGGPSSVNPEAMAKFMDFYIIGDGEAAVPAVMETIRNFKNERLSASSDHAEQKDDSALREELLLELVKIPGVYVPGFYGREATDEYPVKPLKEGLPLRVFRQVMPLNDSNQPTRGLVSYLSLVFDRQVLEVRRGCDRGCRFCQPGYTFLPVRERSADDLLRLSKEAIANTGHEEYSMLSLCVSDYTSLHESVRALNREHATHRTSMSFPSQRADRMNLDIAEELKAVRKSGITLAPEAGTERLRAVINKGLRHEQIISAIRAAYISGWSSVKLYYMIGLPTELDEDLQGIVDTLQEATTLCRDIRKNEPEKYRRDIEFTCTISNFVPKPFTPFQWFAQVPPEEFARKQQFLRDRMKVAKLRNVHLNCTDTQTSLLEAVISRGDRNCSELIELAWRKGCRFDAWGERFKYEIWEAAATELGISLLEMGCGERTVGSKQPWDVVHVGLMDWWLVKEWEKAVSVKETAPCTENTCHACGICTELDTVHQLASPKPEVMKKNPFVKELAVHVDDSDDVHPSLFFEKPPEPPPSNAVKQRLRVEFCKIGALKFISHLDLHHLFIRAARRANVPLSWTEGFNPSPKISIALSLSLFYESQGEVADFDLTEEVSPEDFLARMNAQLPQELRFLQARAIPANSASVASLVGGAEYQCVLATTGGDIDAASVAKRVEELLASNSVIVEYERSTSKGKNKKKKKESSETVSKDIRPHLFALNLNEGNPVCLTFSVSHGPVAHVKPTEILKLVAPGTDWRITRTKLMASDGQLLYEFSGK